MIWSVNIIIIFKTYKSKDWALHILISRDILFTFMIYLNIYS